MEVLDGKSLREVLDQEGFLPVEKAVLIVAQALRGLACAHQRGIIHRDVKPSNVMVLSNGTTKLLDFGIAKFLDSDLSVSLTAHGVAIGTVKYMAPEQLSGRSLDHRADIYAMGLVLYEALTGVHPFQSQASRERKIYARLKQPAPPMDLFARQAIPQTISKIVSQMLAVLPENRPGDALSVASHLMAAIGRPVQQLDLLGVELSFTTNVATSIVRRSDTRGQLQGRSSAPTLLSSDRHLAIDDRCGKLQKAKGQAIALLVAIAAVSTLLSSLVLLEISQGHLVRQLVANGIGATNWCSALSDGTTSR
jgi:serine/threonine protein kinase